MSRHLKVRSRKVGFTLIELLVVIAITATLAALLIPAVHRMRAANARAQTVDNCRMCITAVHSYHDVYKRLPAAGKHGTYKDQTCYYMSIYHQLLPFAEQEPLWKQFHNNGEFYFYGAQLNDRIIPVFLSPEDATHANGLVEGWGACNFGHNHQLFAAGGGNPTGWEGTLRLQTIPDGADQTLAFATKHAKYHCYGGWYSFWCASPFWVGHTYYAHTGFYDATTVPQVNASPFQSIGVYPCAHPYYAQAFSEAGTVVALAGGVVRQLSSELTNYSWSSIMSPSDSVNPDWGGFNPGD